jgi:TonB family protein
LMVLVIAGSLTQCSGLAVQRKGKPKSAPTQVSTPPEKSVVDRCDFSVYAPVRILHFDPDAVAKRVQPEYPLEAARRGIQGRVVVKTLVNERGVIEQACAVDGQEALQQAAERAALQWKLKPGYGLAFLRPRTKKNPKNFAEVYIIFDFKIANPTSKDVIAAQP